MSFISWLTEKRAQVEDVSTLASPSKFLMDFFGGGQSKSGVRVDASMTMSVSAFYRGISIRTNSLAMLPVSVRVRKGEASEYASNHWANELLTNGITPYHLNFAWFKLMEHNRILAGNCYALRVFNGAGETIRLSPINPSRIRASWAEDGTLLYLIRNREGKEEPVPADWIFHLHGSYSDDGISGRPLVDMMRESVGVSLAMQEHGSRLFSNGARIGGILKHPTKFSTKEVAKRVRESFEEANSGLGNAHRTALLEEGMDWVKVSLSSEEAQFLEGRKFEVTEASRWLELPPHMVADLEKSSFNNIEQQGQEFKTHTSQPSVTLWEEGLTKRVLRPKERQKYFWKFNMNALVRADMNARGEYYAKMRDRGVLNADEIRELEDMNPIPGGKGQIYLQPGNMIELGSPPPTPPSASEMNNQPKEGEDPPKKEDKPKAKTRAIEALIREEIRQIRTKEANILRNLLKKSAKNTNYSEFLKDLESFSERSDIALQEGLKHSTEAYAEVSGRSVVNCLDALKEVTHDLSFSAFNLASGELRGAELFKELEEYCDSISNQDARGDCIDLILKLEDVK